MKKALMCLFAFLVLFGLTGCSESTIKLTDKDIQFTLKEDTLSGSRATFIVKNNTNHDVNFGEPYYYLEEEKNGKWYEVEPNGELFFNEPLYVLESGESKEIEIDWEYGYGKLNKGKYRIVTKTIDGKYFAGEFSIE